MNRRLSKRASSRLLAWVLAVCMVCGLLPVSALAVDGSPITVQPTCQQATEGETVTFSVYAVGEDISYQWQRGLPGPDADPSFDRATADSAAFVWTDVAGATEERYSFPATLDDLFDARYRCLVSNGMDTIASNEVFVSEPARMGTRNTPVYWSDEGARASAFAGGDGTSENAYQISNAAQLGYMAYCVNSEWETYKDKYYKLTEDMDLSGYQWMPMGSGSGAFMGVFDGGDFTITNMNISVNGGDGADRFAGLFGKIYGGTVKNVEIGTGASVTANYTGQTGSMGYGAVVGDVSSGGTVENCHSSAAVSVSFSNDMLSAYVGGVVGYLEKGSVLNCSNSGEIGGTSVVAGGVAGGNGNTSAGTIQNCWNTGKITVDGASSYAGGVVGHQIHKASKVENCYNTGDVEGKMDWSYYGGLAGCNNGTIQNCYSSGVLTLPNSNQMSAGGLVGDNSDYSYGKALNSYWRKDIGVNESLSAVGNSGTETDVLSFGNDGAFTDGGSVTIATTPYTSLLPALSAWVDQQTGDYWFWTGAAAAPTLTKDPPPATYAVTIYVNKDDAPWTAHGKTFKLVSSSDTVTNLNAVVNGTYDVYEGDTDTGADVTVQDAAASTTVDYYTVTFYDGDTAYGAGTVQAPQIILKNGKAVLPGSNPIKEEHIFQKWVTEKEGQTAFDFANTPITAATGVYASWLKDTSKEVTVTLRLGKEGPYYLEDSLTLYADVINKATHAPATSGTVQFYKGSDTLGEPVSYRGGATPEGFSLNVVCGASNYFPFLALGENSVKAVYTPAEGTPVETETQIITVSSQKDGSAYVGALAAMVTYDGSAKGVCPAQFLITNGGKDLGITVEQLAVTGKKDGAPFTAFTAEQNEEKTIAYLYVTEPGAYEFTATLTGGLYAATETVNVQVKPADLTITPKDVTIEKGDSPVFDYTASGLRGSDSITSVTYTTTANGNYDTAGTYTISIDTITMDHVSCYNVQKNTATLTIEEPSSTTGSHHSGSSSNTVTTTQKNPDGSVTTTVTNKATGTVTETIQFPDGAKVETVTAPNGDRTYTEQRPDGTKISAAIPQNGDATAAVTRPDGADKPILVSFPVAAGTVVLRVLPDGSEEPIAYSLVEDGRVYVRLEGDAELRVETRENLFDDMPGHWAEGSADFVGARALFEGTAPRTFAPEKPMTRAMLMTVLARIEGVDTATPAGGKWQDAGMRWAMEHQISDGSDPDANITREQIATMLWRYAGSPAAGGSLNGFADADTAHGWARPALAWAVDEGILQGDPDGALNPAGSATRAEAAAMLERFIRAAVK